MRLMTITSVVVLLSCVGLLRADIISDFEAGMDGWGKMGDAGSILSWVDAPSRPGKCLEYWDEGIGPSDWFVAPPKYLGDWTGFASISYDFKAGDADWGAGMGSVLALQGPGTSWGWQGPEEDSTAWFHYDVPLVEAHWISDGGPATWEQTLANVIGFGIGAGRRLGSETNYIDGVTVVVPEPATMTLLALGGIALLRRRR